MSSFFALEDTQKCPETIKRETNEKGKVFFFAYFEVILRFNTTKLKNLE